MSFESAQKILQMYYQSEQQRISSAMELAYNEALTTFKNESAAREAALEVLAQEEKSWRAYQKELAAIRREQMKGNIQLAKINSERAFYNKKEQARIDDINRMRKYQKGVKGVELRVMSGDKMNQDMLKVDKAARTYAEEQATGENLFNTDLQQIRTGLITLLRDRTLTPETFAADKVRLYKTAFPDPQGTTLSSGLDQAILQSQYIKSDPTFKTGSDLDTLRKTRLSDLGEKFLESVAQQAYRDMDDPYMLELRKYIFEGSDTDPYGATGRLKDVVGITPEQRQNVYNTEYDAYMEAYRPLARKSRPPIIRGEPPMKEAVLKEEIPIDTEMGQDLARQAKDVFDALSARDDTPFEIDAEERQNISPKAFQAYEELKRVVPQNPLAVTFEERTLLDDASLERQLSILRQRQQISRMSPYMASPEVIRARAGELLEPSARKAQINIPASAQRYYATENDAFKLSDRSDIDVQNMGVPEQAGVSLYKEMFDATQGGLKDGQTYDQVLDRVNQFFPEDKDKQLRAISAFNSRAMALQRSRNPLVLKDGSQNVDYLEALKALGNK